MQAEVGVRRRKRGVEKRIERELYRIRRMERESILKWTASFQSADRAAKQWELNMMVAEEDMRHAESAFIGVRDNHRKLLIFCRLKGESELKAKSDLKRKEELARRSDKHLHSKQDLLRMHGEKQKERERVEKVVASNCLYTDSALESGFLQKFGTVQLR